MTRETYRWAVVDRKGRLITRLTVTKTPAVQFMRDHTDRNPYGYRIVKFRLVECEEGEGE